MEIGLIIGGFVTILVGLALGPVIFSSAVNVSATQLNGTSAVIAGLVPLVYYVAVLVVGLGAMGLGTK